MSCPSCQGNVVSPIELFQLFQVLVKKEIENGLTPETQFLLNWNTFKNMCLSSGWETGDKIKINGASVEIIKVVN